MLSPIVEHAEVPYTHVSQPRIVVSPPTPVRSSGVREPSPAPSFHTVDMSSVVDEQEIDALQARSANPYGAVRHLVLILRGLDVDANDPS